MVGLCGGEGGMVLLSLLLLLLLLPPPPTNLNAFLFIYDAAAIMMCTLVQPACLPVLLSK
jgi:hypothetical protein